MLLHGLGSLSISRLSSCVFEVCGQSWPPCKNWCASNRKKLRIRGINDTMGINKKTAHTAAASATPAVKEMSDTQRIVRLAIGDVFVFLIFAMLGRNSHNETSGLGALPQIILTALPFALGWFLVSPFMGAFKRDLVGQPRRMAIRTGLAWLASWPVAMLLRIVTQALTTSEGWRIPNWTFFLVTLISNLVFLLVWRWPFALSTKHR